jgi:toxin ParE1/3/4
LIDDRIAELAHEEGDEPDDMAWAKPLVDEARADIARGDVCTLEGHRARNAALRKTCRTQEIVAWIVITASADADTAYILDDLAARAGPKVAASYDAEFDALYRRLEKFPESGAPRPALGRLVRIGIVSPYNIIREYVGSEDTVTIMRIVHGRRRITRRMLNRPTRPP